MMKALLSMEMKVSNNAGALARLDVKMSLSKSWCHEMRIKFSNCRLKTMLKDKAQA